MLRQKRYLYYVLLVGKTYKLSITVPEYAKVKVVRMGMLFNMATLVPIDMRPLTNVGGRRGKSIFFANFTIPKQVCVVICFKAK